MTSKNIATIDYGNLVPPQNIDAEQALLGGLLFGGIEAYKQIESQRLLPGHFYISAHRSIFEACQRLWEAGHEIDLISVCDWLRSRPSKSRKKGNETLLDFVGGQLAIANLAGTTIGSPNLDMYAGLIKDKAARRHLLNMTSRLQELAHSPTPIIDSYNKIQEECLRAMQDFSPSRYNSWTDSVINHFQDVERRMELAETRRQLQAENPHEQIFIGGSTGFPDLDQYWLGIDGGKKIVLGGRSSSGKSTFAQNLVVNLALQGHPVLIIAIEGNEEAYVRRLHSVHSQIPMTSFLRGLSDEEYTNYLESVEAFTELPIRIDAKSYTPEMVRASALQFKADFCHSEKCPVIVVDHLQCSTNDTKNDRIDRIGKMLFTLAQLADDPETNFCTIAVSQLNRACEARDNKRPLIEDLRSSGEIEQEADIVMMIYRDEVYNPDTTEPGTMELIIRKNREGTLGTAKVVYDFEKHGQRLFPLLRRSPQPSLSSY